MCCHLLQEMGNTRSFKTSWVALVMSLRINWYELWRKPYPSRNWKWKIPYMQFHDFISSHSIKYQRLTYIGAWEYIVKWEIRKLNAFVIKYNQNYLFKMYFIHVMWHFWQACVPRDPERCMWRQGRWRRCSVLTQGTSRGWPGPVTSSQRGTWIRWRTCPRRSADGRACWFMGGTSWFSRLLSTIRAIIPALWGKIQMYPNNIPQKKITHLQLKRVGRYGDTIHLNDLHSIFEWFTFDLRIHTAFLLAFIHFGCLGWQL